jgi:Tol biopolymer transport system component
VALDDRLTKELERAARPADPSGVFEELIRRRERRAIHRRLSVGLVAIGVLAVSVGSVVVLSRTLTGETPERRRPGEPGLPTASNGAIVFTRADERGQHLYLVEPDGSAVRQLTHGDVFDEAPDWSPDGTRLAFVRWDGAASRVSLMVMDVSTGETRAIAGGPCAQPDWSPDGTAIAFSSRVDGNGVIATVSPTGGEPRVVADDGFASAEDPDWSPDRAEIVFEATRSDAPSSWDIYGVAPDGSGLRNITETPAPDESEVWPRWSPDGTSILVARGPGVMTGDDVHLYFLITPDGRTIRQVNDGSSFDQEPNWSPDGRYLVFDSDRSGATEVWTLDLESGELSQVTNGGGAEPAWQPIEAEGTSSPSPEPTRTAEDLEDIGSGLALCDVTSVSGIFLQAYADGQTAYVGMVPRSDGSCPDVGAEVEGVAAVDLTGDGVADVASESFTCDGWCNAYAAPDVDGDGGDELLVQNVAFSIAGVKLFDFVPDEDAPALVPVTVAPPGDTPFGYQGFEAGTEPQLWIGGDAFLGDAIRCEERENGRVLVSTKGELRPPDSVDSTWYVTETSFGLERGELHVLDVREFQSDADFGEVFVTTGCGADLQLEH